MQSEIREIELEGSVDPHVHARDDRSHNDGRMEIVIPLAESEHEDLILILNTPAIVTSEGASEYLRRARRYQQSNSTTRLHAAPLLTDQTTPEMIHAMRRNDDIACVKGFLKGVSNDGGKSVSDIRALEKTLYALHDAKIDAPAKPADWHMERKFDRDGNRIDIADREWYAIEHDLKTILAIDPEGSHTVKHVSDKRTALQVHEYRKAGHSVYAEFSPHYFIQCLDDLFEGPDGGTAFDTKRFCVPLFKSKESQQCLIDIVPIGAEEGWAFIGSDFACHIDDATCENGVKINARGLVCPGLAIVPAHSKSIVIDLFVKSGRPDLLNNVLSRNARRAYGMPAASTKKVYVREDCQIPESTNREGVRILHFMGGKTYSWQKNWWRRPL